MIVAVAFDDMSKENNKKGLDQNISKQVHTVGQEHGKRTCLSE